MDLSITMCVLKVLFGNATSKSFCETQDIINVFKILALSLLYVPNIDMHRRQKQRGDRLTHPHRTGYRQMDAYNRRWIATMEK